MNMKQGLKKKKAWAETNLTKRDRKARHLRDFFGSFMSFEGASILDVGCGAGRLCLALQEGAGDKGRVVGADIKRQECFPEEMEFIQLSGPELPCSSGMFDIVISNHVIEHVGESGEQRVHLEEIVRALKPGGIAYVAFPSRWAIDEPHYHLPFLSWLPRPLATLWLKKTGRSSGYDCWPLSKGQFRHLASSSGGETEDVTGSMIEYVLAGKRENAVAGAIWKAWAGCPGWLRGLLSLASPSFCFVIRVPGDDADGAPATKAEM